ncbi:MAG: C69 family dipeptidase [Dehalococcoidia bacterium]|nr:C69 family dipeptidase [Dehalococcoidia bacterium]
MCDTIVALEKATVDGATLFGKNSDREPDEVQNIVIYPRRQHKNGDEVRCTYISIPQASETARVMLSQPFWMFGAEMGSNEYGVFIGNEALFTREKPAATGLTGMDLLRLALERSRSATEALDTVIRLLEKYGQGGNCGYRQKFLYMNSFLIADSSEAFVLETVKSWWAWKKIKDVWSISNVISIGQDFDAVSPDLIENAIKKGWCKTESDFDFNRCYTDPLITWGAAAKGRQACSRNILSQKNGSLTTADFMELLRDHGGRSDFHPDKHGGTVCMHAADKLIRRSQSVGSLVGKASGDHAIVYVTGSSNPCLSPFYPVFSVGTASPAGYLEGGAEYNGETYWWECERFHRRALLHYPDALKAIQPRIMEYEVDMLQSVESAAAPPTQAEINRYFNQARGIVKEWGAKLDGMPVTKPGWLFRRYWQGYNKLNGID